jgi:hypothetical protein
LVGVLVGQRLTTTTIAILVAAELARAVPGGNAEALIVAAATLAVLTGAMLVAAFVLRLGTPATTNTRNQVISGR